MKTRSRKAKGRRLQNWVRDELLERFPNFSDDDIIEIVNSVWNDYWEENRP